jgi:thiol-disulfide isomerase/thioredoxin
MMHTSTRAAIYGIFAAALFLTLSVWQIPGASAAQRTTQTPSGRTAQGPTNRIVEGSPMPPIKFLALDGKRIDISSFKDKVVIIQFWATWCGPCIGEIPALTSLYKEYHEDGLEIVGISLDEKRGDLEGFLTQRQIEWPQHFDGKRWKNAIASRFGVRAIPLIVLVDRQGSVAKANIRGKELKQAVTAMFPGHQDRPDNAQNASRRPADTSAKARISTGQCIAKASDPNGNSIEIISIEPKSPATLALGQQVCVQVRYALATDRPVHIYAMGGNGDRGSDCGISSGSTLLERKKTPRGVVTRWFHFRESAATESLCVKMYDQQDNTELLRCVVPFRAQWKAAQPAPRASAKTGT